MVKASIILDAAVRVEHRYVNGEVPISSHAVCELAAEVCEIMLSDPKTLARALANLTPEQRAEVMVLYDKLATLGI